MEEDSTQELLLIGELADAMGVTVRAIRHYEAVGLLGPAERSCGGHRRYGEGDVAQLRRVVALRRCGFGLEAIRRLLDASSRDDALAVAERQLERAEVELEGCSPPSHQGAAVRGPAQKLPRRIDRQSDRRNGDREDEREPRPDLNRAR